MAHSSPRAVFAVSDFDVITGPPSLPSRLPSPAGGPLPNEAISGKPVADKGAPVPLEGARAPAEPERR